MILVSLAERRVKTNCVLIGMTKVNVLPLVLKDDPTATVFVA